MQKQREKFMPLNYDQNLCIRDIIINIKTASREYSLDEIADISFSIPRIEKLLTQSDNVQQLDERIAQFLRDRWDRVANTSLCYTLNTENGINLLCHTLAEYCFGTDNALSALMPTVQVEDATYRLNLNSLAIGTFIVSDDKLTFIYVEGLADLAYQRIIRSRRTIYKTTDVNGQERNLTANELKRLGPVYRNLSLMHDLATNRTYFDRLFNRWPIIYDALIDLREGLQAGDARHAGQEMNAGSPANIAIANFYDFYSRLSEHKKQEIRNISFNGHNLRNIIEERLFRNQNSGYGSVQFCIQLIGQQLEEVINGNMALLRAMRLQTRDRIESIKAKISSDIAANCIIRNPIDASSSNNNHENNIVNVLRNNLNHHAPRQDSVEARMLLQSAEFITTECRRLISEKGNSHQNCQLISYTKLLIAISFESYSFNQRGELDNQLVLQEIFKRITIISSLDAGLLRQSSSRRNWKEFLNRLAPNEQTDFITKLKKDITLLVERNFTIESFNTLYSANEQCQILSPEIILARSTANELTTEKEMNRHLQESNNHLKESNDCLKETNVRLKESNDQLTVNLAQQQAKEEKLIQQTRKQESQIRILTSRTRNALSGLAQDNNSSQQQNTEEKFVQELSGPKSMIGHLAVSPCAVFSERRPIAQDKWGPEIKKIVNEIKLDFGSALSTGDCFFDSLAQAIENKGFKIQGRPLSLSHKQLREFCDHYLKKLNRKHSESNWVQTAISQYGGEDYITCLAQLKYTQSEMDNLKREGFFDGISTWGRPPIEGRMLCKILSQQLDRHISLHVMDIQAVGDQLVKTHWIVDENGQLPIAEDKVEYNNQNCLHIANYRSHYVPLVTVSSTKQKVHSVELTPGERMSNNPSIIFSNSSQRRTIGIQHPSPRTTIATQYESPFEVEKIRKQV